MKAKMILSALMVILVVAVAGCQTSGFNEAEKKVINAVGGEVMRVLSVAERGDSALLRGVSAPMDEATLQAADYAVLRRRMLATVLDSLNPGVGIAAPQVGVFRRMVAVQRFDKPGEPFEFYLNPKIVDYSVETAPGGEGCLSVPDLYGAVERSVRITLRYRDEEFRQKEEVIAGFTAVIFQHEVDHLDGILFTDRMKKQ